MTSVGELSTSKRKLTKTLAKSREPGPSQNVTVRDGRARAKGKNSLWRDKMGALTKLAIIEGPASEPAKTSRKPVICFFGRGGYRLIIQANLQDLRDGRKRDEATRDLAWAGSYVLRAGQGERLQAAAAAATTTTIVRGVPEDARPKVACCLSWIALLPPRRKPQTQTRAFPAAI